MANNSYRLDDPAALKSHVERLKRGAELAVDIPVEISSQDSRDVAYSVFDATFVAEAFAPAFEWATLSFEKDATDPNSDLLRVSGILSQPWRITRFIEEWFETLDANGTGGSFLESDTAERLFERMNSDEDLARFRWPELVEWFRSVRAHFDAWDEDDDNPDEDA